MDINFSTYMRFALALLFVLGLIGILVAVARRFGFGYAAPSKKGRVRRLSIVEVMPVDAKHRVVLVRRDDKEHLILISQTSGTLIEGGIEGGNNETQTAENGAMPFITPPWKKDGP